MTAMAEGGVRTTEGLVRPLRVAFISEELPPETGWGGIGTYTDVISRALGARGHDVTVITRGWDSDTDQVVDGVRVIRLVVPQPSWRRGTVRLTEALHESREMLQWARRVASTLHRLHDSAPLDIVEAPEYHAQGLLVSRRIPLVVRLHAPAFVNRSASGVRIGGSALDAALAERLERLPARRSRLVTSPTREMLERVRARWKLGPAEVMANPVDVERFEHVPPPDGVQTILHVGRISRRKGVEHLVEALPLVMREVPGLRLRFVGKDHPSGPGGVSMIEHLGRRLTALNVPEGVVTFDGYRDRKTLPDVYGDATVCVVPSLYESFGYTCVEAMASGRALVATSVGGIPEVVTDGVDGVLVPPADPGRLAAALSRLLTDHECRRRLEAQARRSARERFGVDVVADRFELLYDGVVTGARR